MLGTETSQSQEGLCLLTSPMSVCASVSFTALASATNALKVKVRYQKESTRCREQINVGIELKILGSKVMTVITYVAYHEIFSWHLRQKIDASRSLVLLEEN